ncbi:MAG: Gfo/Idh/MocA family oxidoreductase [Phycisphaeraceae bacterium]|nr:Gfo/Idh/MocA family oxidoreductase [Phycisphaeraceae bacterium]
MKPYPPDHRLRTAVVGYGAAYNIGRQHLQEMEAAGMVPVAVADTDPARLEAARADFPDIQTYRDLTELLARSEVELVTIITPHNTHAPLAMTCLEAGRHVVTEKPFTITTDQCDRLIKAAASRDLLLSTYHNRHWDGCILEATEHIKAGRIGQVVRIDCRMGRYGRPGQTWRGSKSISGGILYDWGAHFLDYAFQIITAPMVEVAGVGWEGHWGPQTTWKEDANEDEAFVLVRFEGGQWLTLRVTCLETPPAGTFWVTVVGTEGTYRFDLRDYELTTLKGEETVTVRGRNRPNQSHCYYQNIADHLLAGQPLVITPQWARRPIHVLDLAGRSRLANRSLAVEHP